MAVYGLHLYITSFFGCISEIWTAILDEWIDTDNYIAFTYSDKMTNVLRGYELNSSSKTLIHPYLAIDDARWKKSLKASATTTTSVSLTWDSYPVPATCTLERLETGSIVYTTVASLPHRAKTFTDTNLKNGTSYNYRIKAGSTVKLTGEITFECWLRPKELEFSMPARIASISASDEELGFALDQQLEETADKKELSYHVRMQTSSTVSLGYPEFTPDVSQPYINLQHLLYTRNVRGMESVYLNGVKSSEGFRPSELDTWKDNYYLRLGNESDMNHSWNGSYYSVAIYNRALLPAEVSINYETGPCDSVQMADVDYSVNAYPNPAVDKIILQIVPVKITDNVPHTTICIWDAFGRLQYRENLFNPKESLHKELNMDTLSSGIYLIQVF